MEIVKRETKKNSNNFYKRNIYLFPNMTIKHFLHHEHDVSSMVVQKIAGYEDSVYCLS